jgi:hypothetical protein
VKPDFAIPLVGRISGHEGDATMTMAHHVRHCLPNPCLVINRDHGVSFTRCNKEDWETLIAQLLKIA